MKFRGYFDLYNIPFKYISLFDFTEKKSPLRPGGMNRGPPQINCTGAEQIQALWYAALRAFLLGNRFTCAM